MILLARGSSAGIRRMCPRNKWRRSIAKRLTFPYNSPDETPRVPCMTEMGVTQLLRAWNDGDPTAFPRLVPLVYEQLRRLAARQLPEPPPQPTLHPPPLFHE